MEKKKRCMDIEKNLAHKMHSNSILHMKISLIFKHDLVSAALQSKDSLYWHTFHLEVDLFSCLKSAKVPELFKTI